jgi:hypothetical protein
MILPVGAGLGLERRLYGGKMRAEPAQHLFQHAILPDAQPLAHDLNVGVAVSDVPGEARKLLRGRGRDLDQRLWLAGNQDDGAVVEHEAVAVVQHGRVRKIEQDLCAPLAAQDHAATMALIRIEHHPVDDAQSIKPVRATNR